MKGHTHALLGVTAAVAVHAYAPYLITTLPGLGIALVAAGVGSLLPDLDADESLIRHQTHTARSDGPLGHIVSWLMPSHRGITHSGMAALAMVGFAWLYPHDWLIALAIGYISHLSADMLTRGGVPLLWPFRWRLSLTSMVTGGLGEYAVALSAGGWLWVYVMRHIGAWKYVEPYLHKAMNWLGIYP